MAGANAPSSPATRWPRTHQPSQPFNRFQGEEDAKLGGWCISQSNEKDINVTGSQRDSQISVERG